MPMKQVWNPSTRRMDQVWFSEPREDPRPGGEMREVWSEKEQRMVQVWFWEGQHHYGTLEDLKRRRGS